MKYTFVIILFLYFNITFAQEDRYWSTSFNTEASLLAGAVVGGNSNITSIYYNPAGISEIEEKKIMLNVNLFKLSSESYKNIIDDKENINNLSFRVQPRFVSYIYRSKKNRKLSYQFAVFTKSAEYKSISAYTDKTSEIIISNTEQTFVKNSYDYFNEYNDYWGGVGVSYQINDKLSVGISGFISVKNLLYSVNQYYIISPEDGLIVDSSSSIIIDNSERIKMYDVRLRSKVGVRYKIKRFSIGLNVTIPSLKLFGNGDVKRRYTYTDDTDTSLSNNVIIHENSPYRECQIKDPFSIALGGVYYFNKKKSQLYFTVEYFNEISTYYIIDGTKAVNSKKDEYPGGTNYTSYKFGVKGITNYAIGYKQILNKNVDLMFGFRTDFNAYKVSDSGEFSNINEIQNIHNDLFHFTVGSNFNYKRSQFILGVQYSYGEKDNLSDYNEGDYSEIYKYVGINNKDMIYTIKSLGLFIGYSLNF